MKTVIIVSKCVITNLVKDSNSAAFAFTGTFQGLKLTGVKLSIPNDMEMPLVGVTYLIYANVTGHEGSVLTGEALKMKPTTLWDAPALNEV